MQALIGNILDRCSTDTGYRGHNAPPDHKFKVYTSGQKRRVMKGLKLPDTTLSRSIVLTLKRKRRTDIVRDFMHQDDAELRNLRDQLARWAQDNIEKLRAVCPALPQGFQNRLAANWRPLFAIADLCGGDWPERARSAARALSKEDVDSLYVQALAAIRDLFDAEAADLFTAPQHALMFSRDIVKGLLAIEDGPWQFYAGKDRDKPITQNGLARLLKPIAPQTIRIGDKTAKGYYRHQFEDEFERYLGGGPADEESEDLSAAPADVQNSAATEDGVLR
jgi:uncharacterized protein DUF3631